LFVLSRKKKRAACLLREKGRNRQAQPLVTAKGGKETLMKG